MSSNPMHQFEVYKIGPEINLGSTNLSFTNASLFMTISAAFILLFLFAGTKKKSLIPSKLQLVTEMSYTFVAKMINDTAGSRQNLISHLSFHFLCLCFFAICLA